jgi:hypothetical protein
VSVDAVHAPAQARIGGEFASRVAESCQGSGIVQDAIFIAIAIGFIALCVAYVRGLDTLVGPDPAMRDDGEAAS